MFDKNKTETRPYFRLKCGEVEVEGFGAPYGNAISHAEGLTEIVKTMLKLIIKKEELV